MFQEEAVARLSEVRFAVRGKDKGVVLMKSCVNRFNTGLVALLVMGLLSASVQGQPAEEVPEDAKLTARKAELIGLLDADLRSLAERSRRDRRIAGWTVLGLGIGSGIGGMTVLAVSDGGDARIVGASLLGGGALLSGLSLLPFKLRGEAERIYDQFSEMPSVTPGETHQKLVLGESRFEGLAEKKRTKRKIGGISSLATGTAALIIGLATDHYGHGGGNLGLHRLGDRRH